MQDALIDRLRAKRDNYDQECTWMRFLVDSYEGCGGYQGKVRQPAAGYWGSAAEIYSQFTTFDVRTRGTNDSYLDRYPREDEPKFARRREVAHYLNYIKPIANTYASYLLRKPPTRADVPARLQQWIDDTAYDSGARLRALLAIVCGWHPVLVDMPQTDPEAPSEMHAGPTGPYLVQLQSCHLVDYSADDDGEFHWAKVCVKYTKRETWDGPAKDCERYTVWTPETWTTFEVVNDAVEKIPDGNEFTTGPNPFGVVPLAIFRSNVSLNDPVKSESLLGGPALEGRRLFNLLSEFDEHLRSQVFALLTYPIRSGGGPNTAAPSIVGTDNALAYDSEAKSAPNYLAPPSSVAATYEKRIEATIVEIFRMARVEYTRASGTQSSAQSKAQEFESTNLTIADLASALAQAEKRLLTIVGLGLGIDRAALDAMTITPADDFNTEQLNDEVDRLVTLLTVRELGATFKGELLKRVAQRILPRLPKEMAATIESEIDEAVTAAEQEAEMLRQAAVDAAQNPPDQGDGSNDDPVP